MKVFNVSKKVKGSGEYILGYEDTGSHACYMIYGVMSPGEKGRELKPGKGHEELILAVKGSFRVSGAYSGILNEGEAIHLKGDEQCFLENVTEDKAIYIAAGGHSEAGHH